MTTPESVPTGQYRTLARVIALLFRTDRRLAVRAAISGVVTGAVVAPLGFAARGVVNALAYPGSGDAWLAPALWVVVGVATLMAATWLNYGAVSTLSILLGRDLDLVLLDAERRRRMMNHLDTEEVQKLAATVDEQRENVAGLPASCNAALTLLAGGVALLVLALSVSVLLLPLFLGLVVVAWGAAAGQGRVDAVSARTAASTRITRALFALLTAAGPAKDIRTGGAAGILVEDYRQVWDEQDAELHRARRNSALIVGAAQLVLVALFGVTLTLTLTRPGLDAGTAVVAFVLAVQATAIGGTSYPVLAVLGHGLGVYRQLVALVSVRDGEPAVPDPVAAHRPPAVISLRDVTVRYPGAQVPALDGVSLDVRAGDLVAIVGENGSGKSTLAGVLLGLRRPDHGRVEPGGGLRVSSVFQDFARFETTVGRSVRFGDPGASDDRVRDVLVAVGAGDWLAALPDGLDTAVGSASRPGLDLSGGQWQRLALGRGTIAEDHELIVLDEAMSALDAHTEQTLIQTQLSQARRHTRTGPTTVVLITHRMSAARLADVIHVLSDGRIVDSGTHEELLRRGGLYAQMFAMQANGYR
jgi:ATP-binding cassette subfamily B protein